VLLSLKYFDSKLSHKIGRQSRVIDLVRRVSVQGTPAPSDAEAAASPSALKSATPAVASAASATSLDDQQVYARAAQVLNSPCAAYHFLSSPHHALLEGPDHRGGILVPSPRGTPSATDSSALSPPLVMPRPATPVSARLHDSIEKDENEAGPALMGTGKGRLTGRDIKKVLASSLSWPAVPATDSSESVVVDGEGDGTGVGAAVALEEAESPEVPTSLASLSLGDWTQSFKLFAHQLRTMRPRDLALHVAQDMLSFLFVSTFYLVPLLGAAVTFAPLALMVLWHPLPWYCYTLYGAVAMLYVSSYRNRPSITGSRSWPLVRDSELIWGSMERYFSGQVIALAPLPATKGPYIFGFAPHGVYPASILWATRGPQFRRAYPDLHVDVCGATIMFYAPLLRDICMWSGGREVSGTALRIALKQKRSILIVPGGQREMRHSVADPTSVPAAARSQPTAALLAPSMHG